MMKKKKNAILAIRWDSGTPRTLSYMILDADYKYIKKPSKFEFLKTAVFEDSKKRFDEILEEIYAEAEKIDSTVRVHYKTLRLISPYSRQSNKSATHELGKYIDECIGKTFVNCQKVNADLEGGKGLKKFKRLFSALDLYPNESKKAYVHHLWAVALRATPKKWDVGLKKIWRIQNNTSPNGPLPKDKRAEMESFFTNCLNP